MAKAEATVEDLVSKIKRGELQGRNRQTQGRPPKASKPGETDADHSEQMGLAP